ncbi:bifunctional 2',3'-cyclic-nucleotide 2'-phosphodiesterase/3'-nucleotidase [Halobacillus locisalis]|uniref:Bifunctional 2',3'-cyclic-nucleotide 2'-phosphodiesterase/3'-nucleotidase n=1 Tax=Halobacillus locisalis TaxID=220753 RepID=A0A838CW09_9BACI|nr:bifunctional 2',3'-cyclic-nucleotide 2'-phosphodiesterase/3'-nucleotidase [Halobacillus locisalis]MBA2176150.1 bifunctional 2',3'-cyclic-nucleotide 2'-phosphodiesterase/3'-nucleotidase [Halobacillus locisalis]
MGKRNHWKWTTAAIALGMTVSSVAPSATFAAEEDKDVVNLQLMETTDIHSHVMNYDYFSDQSDETVGLVKVATLINEARKNAKNSMLFDNGDLIQGNPMADYIVNEEVLDEDGNVHPVYKAMNLLDYDVGNYGNHEFNYGLTFLKKAVEGADFPYVNANVYKADEDDDPTNNENYFDPYVIVDKEVTDEDGDTHTIKVGVIGFVPPQIMTWDKDNLEGKVETRDLKATAEKFVPQMKEEGADVVVGIAHSGLGSKEEYVDGAENATYQLSTVDGFDALLFGHSHQTFPSSDYAELDGKYNINLDQGTINGVATTQAGFWGSDLGMIDLQLEKVDGEWTVTNGQASTKPIYDHENGEALVDADQDVLDAVKDDHEGTQDYVATPVGETEVPLYSYFAQVQDDPTVQIVNDAQKQYVEKYIQGTELDGLPVLSAAAPFKAGRDGVSDFTDIPAGGLAIKDTTSLYKYPNTLKAVKINGAQVIEWLEWSAGQFNQVDPSLDEEQELVNPEFRSYNFDVIDGLTYQIDVTEAPRYNNDGEKINDSSRIENVMFQGEPIDPEQEFLVATNNYRATSKFANPDGDNVVIDSPDENRQVLVNYIQDSDSINPQANGNWSFAPVEGDATLTFVSSPKAQKYAEDNDRVDYLATRDDGFAVYSMDLNSDDGEEIVFDDVAKGEDGHWAASYIYDLVEDEIIFGYGNGNFGPEDPVTRGQFTELIVRMLGLENEEEVPFQDVSARSADAIAAAYEHGIIHGYSETSFKPGKLITREQMAHILLNAYNVKNDTDFEATTDVEYEDEAEISKLFMADVDAAHELGLMVGYHDKFDPKASADRGEAAKVLYMLKQK